VLGSGSGGNCTAIRVGGQDFCHAVLIDAGFGPRTTAQRLHQAGLTLADVKAVCLTHLDRDHFRLTWLRWLVDLGVRLCLHRWHAEALRARPEAAPLFEAGLVTAFDGDAFAPLPGLSATPVRLQHDLQGTIGYRLSAGEGGGAVGYATDLGHVPAELVERFAGVDVLCLESNYDEHMTVTSARPSFVNRRNLSDSGHLSNEQSFEAVRAICDRSPGGRPRHIVLMHRSQQCNHETKVRRVFERDRAIARRVVLAEQRRRTRWLTAVPAPACVQAQLPLMG